MAVTKKIQIQNPAGTGFDSRDIGAEGQYIEVSRDSNGNIIEDITASGVIVDSTESLTETLKNIEDNKQDKVLILGFVIIALAYAFINFDCTPFIFTNTIIPFYMNNIFFIVL